MADEAPQVAAAIQAQSADGMIHQFPAGTDPTVIDGVMKKYAADNAPPKPAEPAEPVSGTLKGMGKAAGQEAITSVAQTISGVGAVTKMVGGAERQETNTDLDLYNKLDAGEDFRTLSKAAPNDLARMALRAYQISTPEQKTKIRQDAMNVAAAPEGQLELSGEHIQKAGEKLGDYAKAAIPLTPEEESRSTVIGTKMVVGLTKYIGAALAGGMPAVVGIAGVDAFGDTYDKARLAGRTDAEATGDAMINGMVQGGLMTVPIGQATKIFDTIPVALKGEFVKALAEAGKSGLTLVGFSQVATIADNVVAKSTYDPSRKPLEGVGEHLPETFVAGAVLPLAAAGMARVARGRTPAEVAKPVLDAPTVDDAIDKAKAVVSEPVDVNAAATQAREFGGEGEQQQAKLNQLFGGLNEGEVRPTQDGGYAYARGDQEIPLKVWDEFQSTPPTKGGDENAAPTTISQPLAKAQRDHYQKLGIDVVYFDDPTAKVPFDGAVDPQNPNTVFLSNNPQRNAAQVGAHELTHVLESTTLPDGTSLADILHGQVKAGMTPEGLTHALTVFGKTAPERGAFPEGAEGDAAHQDAVVRHITTELGADIGGEAPKFQTFLPRVVDEVQRRYGDDAAKGVVQKLIAGIQQAMRTLREFFFHPEEHAEYGQPETASQRWVTNLDEIHGTLAKMYAERFGTRAEKENAALVAMRDQAQRDRFVETGREPVAEAPVPPPGQRQDNVETMPPAPERAGPPPAPGYDEARQKAATYARWLRELDEQRRQAATTGPQATLLRQTEATILGKVNGVEARLTNVARGRLETIRQQLADMANPTGDSPAMAKVRAAMVVEHQRMADAAAVGSARAPIEPGRQNATEVDRSGPARGRAVMPGEVATPTASGAARPARPQRAAEAPVAKPGPTAAGEATAATAAPPPGPSAVFAEKVRAETERVWADRTIMGKTHRGVTRNEQFATDVARERVMREEAAPQIEEAIKRGIPADAMEAVSKFYRPVEGETIQQAFDKAADRWITIEEAKGAHAFGDEEAATYDMLKEDFRGDPVLSKAFELLDEHHEGTTELPGDEDIPFGTAETAAPEGAGEEAARADAGRPEGEEAGAEPGRGGEVPPDEGGALGPQFSPKGETEPKGPTLLETKEATKEELAARQRARDKEEAEARMRGRKGGKVGQESVDETPLFGGPRQSTLFSPKREEPFFSALTRGVEGLKLEKATPGQWEATIKNMPGVKAEERAWVGLEDWLRQQAKSVTKAEVLGYLREHEVKVTEVQKGGSVPREAIDALKKWADDTYGKSENAEGASELDFEGAARGDHDAIQGLEGWGAPDHLMKPIYDSIGGGATKFGSYVLPGGKNYKELLLTLPETPSAFDPAKVEIKRHLISTTQGSTEIHYGGRKVIQYSDDPQLQPGGGYKQRSDEHWMEVARKLYDVGDLRNAIKSQSPDFRGGHWDEPNVLAHIRMDDRTGPGGEKVLHVAEIQSDWHQKGRKQGYARDTEGWTAQRLNEPDAGFNHWQVNDADGNYVTKIVGGSAESAIRKAAEAGVPDAPFKTSWPELAMKRVLRYAAENGYDRVSWDTGDTNAARYDLSKHVDKVNLVPVRNAAGQDHFRIDAFKDNEKVIEHYAKDENEIASVVGKEVAEKLLNGRNQHGAATVTGEGLKVGGEGMKAFYDKQLPVIANKIGKRFGAKVEDTTIPADKAGWHIIPPEHSIDGKWIVKTSDYTSVGKRFDTGEAAQKYLEEKAGKAEAHSIEVTPAMREGVMQGQPLFSPKQTESPEFKRWFGDSKVVDEEGKPAVMYHGTNKDVGGTFRGVTYWTRNPDEASGYAENRSSGGAPNVVPGFLRIERPASAEDLRSAAEAVGKYDEREQLAPLASDPAVMAELKRRGFDGVMDVPDFGFRSDHDMFPVSVTFEPEQIKSATGNRGTFDAGNPDIRMSPKQAPLSPTEQAAYDRVFAKDEPFSLKKWFNDAKADLGKKAIAAALDPYIAVKESDPQGYMALRNANTTAGANEVFRRFGTVKFDGSTYALDARNGGVENHLLRPLAGEADRFIKWVAANRAEQLSKEGRENLFSDQDIATIKKTNQGTVDFDYTLSNGKTTRSREAIFLDSLAKYDVFNKNVLDAELGSGLISKETYDTLRQNKFYVPFLREASETDKGFTGPNASAGFVKQQAFKKLKGGTEKLNDLWDNAFANWQHGIDASLSNRAAAQVLDTAANSALPSARRMTLQEVKYLSDKELKARTTWVMENGKQVHYEITDPLLFKAVSAAEPLGDALGLLTAGRFFKRVLQTGVTMNPMFAVRNLIRDTQQTLATAPQNINIAKNLADGFKMNDMGGALGNIARASAGRELRDMALSDEAVNAIAGGATMRLAAGSDTGIRDTKISSMLNTPEKLNGFMNYLGTLGDTYRKAMEQGEDVNRMSLYKNLRAQGVPHDAASFAARDLADFTLSGASTAVRVIVATVPFLNARLQGLYKVGRSLGNADQTMGAAVGLPDKSSTARAATVLGVTALAVMALDQIYANDEDYKKRTDYDRDTYYWFKFGDTQVRIPMGFEIATLSRMAANTAEVFFDKEMTGRRLAESTWSMIGTNLQMNPIPQALKPIYDIATNIGGTGRHIEPKGMEDLPPEQRYTVNNTLAARGLSSMISSVLRAVPGLDSASPSPIQIDYLVNAYGGWLATSSLGMADTAARSMTSEPARPAKDMWAAATQGMISSEPSPQSRYVEMLYRQGTQVEQAYAAYRDMLQRGLAKEAQQYFEDNRELIQKHGLVSGVMRLEGSLNKQIRMITNNPNPAVTPEMKRIQIMRLQAIQSRAAEQVFGAQR